MKVSKQEYDEALGRLKEHLKPGDRIYGVIRSVARSGRSRTIDFYVMISNQPVYISGWMGTVLKTPRNKQGALKVRGCGMDMIFDCVYELSRAVFGNGYTLKHDSL